MNEKQKEICQKVADIYNAKQLIVAMEECAELIQAISKYLRLLGDGQPIACDKVPGAYENIAEECADVLIMIEQLRWVIGISDEHLSKMIDKKLERTIRRIKEHGA